MGTWTPEEAIEVVSKLEGPEGVDATIAELTKQIDGAKASIASLQGQVTAYQRVLRMMQALKKRWGLEKGLGVPSPEGEAEPFPEPDESPLAKEVQERISKGLCTHRPRKTKKWCARKLRTKAEQECGYCKTCMNELEIKAGASKSSSDESK